MNKAYTRVNGEDGWKNFPSIDTPLNKTNLDKVDIGLNEVDNRVIVLDETKATKVEVSTLFKEVEYDEKTGIITFTRKSGAKVTIDTPMEKIALNIYYDPVTEMLALPLIDGTYMEVDLSRLITEYEFLDSDTIAFSVKPDGKVTAIVKEGSIEEKHLRPDYLADIKVEAGKAQTSAAAAAMSEANALKSENAAKASQTEAKTSETNAKTSEANAKTSETNAASSKTAAKTSETNAATSATNAKTSETNAASSKTTAATSATNAATSATNAANSATSADTYAKKSQSYAVGGTGTRAGEDTDNAEYYYEQSKRVIQGVSGIVPMGTISFDGLSSPGNQEQGYMFNVSDSFVSDNRFQDGGGIFYGAGNNVLYTADGKWDVLAGVMVSGVKGGKETEYRQGFVNITSDDIGLGSMACYKGSNNSGDISGDLVKYNVTPDMTLEQLWGALPDWSIWEIFFNSQNNTLGNSMPVTSGGMLTICKQGTRGFILFFDYRTGRLYTTPRVENKGVEWRSIDNITYSDSEPHGLYTEMTWIGNGTAGNEEIVTGRKFRRLSNGSTKLWQRISLWTKASDVEFNDGNSAETKLGAIKGITKDWNIKTDGYAADMTALVNLRNNMPIAMTQAEYDSLPDEEKNSGRWYGIYEEG